MSSRSRWLSIFVVGWLLSNAQLASANASCSAGSILPSPFIWLSRYLVAGTTYTIKTANITGDTVLHLMKPNPSGEGAAGKPWVQVAYNDDAGTSVASTVVYKPTVTGSYMILVRGYSSTTSGVADVVVNGTTVLTQNPYGGYVWAGERWSNGDEVRLTSTRRTQQRSDTLLFLLASSGSISQLDDDSGPNFDSFVKASTTATTSARVVYGSFPGTAGSLRLTVSPSLTTVGDADADGLMDSLETACGLDTSTDDSDHDSIWDAVELLGNDGFSYSQGSQYTDSHKRRNIYVEVDAMVNPANAASVPVPYAALASDMAVIFNSDAAIDIFVDASGPALPYWPQVAMTSCAGAAANTCVTMPTLRAAHFSPGSSERQAFFHYAVYGDELRSTVNCSSGQAPMLGTNILVTLGTTVCNWNGTTVEQRGTFLHELGHNLRLSHHDNDASSGNFGTAHDSVMNYRYQRVGVSRRPAGVLASTYSFGTEGCARCDVSPKQRCIDAVQEAFFLSLLTGNNTTCYSVDVTCDCDVHEWDLELTVDFVRGTRPPQTGAPSYAAGATGQDTSLAGEPTLLAEPLSADERDLMRAAIATNTISRREGPLKATEPDTWHGPMPDFVGPRQQSLVRQQVTELEARGRMRGRDFEVAPDGRAIYENCR